MGYKEKTLQERMEIRKDSLSKLQARISQQKASQKPKKQIRASAAATLPEIPPAAEPPTATAPDPTNFIPPLLRTSDGSEPLHLTPWGRELALSLLKCARDQTIALRLIWPAEIDTVVSLHAVANLGAILDSDLSGIRTLYYPGTDATWATLDRITTDRSQFDALCKALYNDAGVKRDSDSVRAALTACHEANYAKNTPLLRIRQMIPAFRYDRTTAKWVGARELPIDALIKRLPKIAMKAQLRARIDPLWTDAWKAPGALLVLHRDLNRKALRAALGGGREGKRIRFDAVLLDASTRSIQANPGAVKSIPKHLSAIKEAAGGAVGALIVTNDPAFYGSLAKELEREGFQIDKQVLAAEATGTEWLASSKALGERWTPELRKTVNFKIRATDEPATRLAKQIRKIADAVRTEGADVEEPFLRAQHLVQRASLLPGGIRDAMADGGAGGWSPLSAQLDFTRIVKQIHDVLARGGATTQRTQIAEIIEKTRSQLESCSEATPLAEQLKQQIERYVVANEEQMVIVIFSSRDIAIAQQYLTRVLGDSWISVRHLVQWLTLTEALTELCARASGKRLIIVGFNPRILRFLAAQVEVPLHTNLLLPTYQAARMLPQLRFLSGIDVLKPYRSRLADLRNRMETTLEDVPDIESLVRVYDTRLPSSTLQPQAGITTDPAAYRLHLDDGQCISVSGYVFRYEGLEDTKFHRVSVRDLVEGDSIFEMSDELRDEVESALATQFTGFQFSQFRTPLDGYRALLNQFAQHEVPFD